MRVVSMLNFTEKNALCKCAKTLFNLENENKLVFLVPPKLDGGKQRNEIDLNSCKMRYNYISPVLILNALVSNISENTTTVLI